jgi:sugar/nucleoside kinase (ribokinase family)
VARVVVVGDAMLDVVTRPTTALAPTSDTPAHTRVGRGGSGANLAVALARAGHEVHYVAAVGRDAPGRIVHDELARAGVTARLEEVDGATGVVVAVVAADGQRAMLTDRGVNPLLSSAHVREVLRHPFDHLHVSGYTILDAATRAVGADALGLARAAGSSSSVDLCSVAPLMRVTPRVFLESAADATELFANEEEALALSDAATLEAGLDDLAQRFAEVVVTRGAAGAVVRRGAEEWRAVARGARVVDTTGAGDAATGAYLASRLIGDDVPTALEHAMTAAAAVVMGLGASGQSRL